MNRRPRHYRVKTPWFNRKYIRKVRISVNGFYEYRSNYILHIYSPEVLRLLLRFKMKRLVLNWPTSNETSMTASQVMTLAM